jgi:nucleoside-diphosphate-sugar epimerase
MSRKVLILGGTGFIGRRLAQRLLASGQAQPVVAARHAPVVPAPASGAASPAARWMRLDTCDEASLEAALREVDAVVHAVAGNERAITQGARALARAVRAAGTRCVIALSSMVVLGEREGQLDESAEPGPVRGWYARAKQEAEGVWSGLAAAGTPVAVLRPGCVWGPGCELWVGRVARWLRSGRLGDLGAQGDGWTNGVHVDDVCQAVEALLAAGFSGAQPGLRHFHLAAPDSPRWNTYFRDIALALQATPLRRISPARLYAQAWLAGPPLHVAGRLAAWVAPQPPGGRWADLPPPLSPGLLRLFARQQQLVSARAERELGVRWTPYPVALHQALVGLDATAHRSALARNTGLPIT